MRMNGIPAAFAVAAAVSVVSLAAAGADDKQKTDTKGAPGAQLFLSVRGDVNKADPDGTTRLHWAVRSGDVARVRALIKAGANVNAANRYGVTPLSQAAEGGDAAIVEALVKAGADVNATVTDGQTILMTAARAGNPASVKTLLDHGAKVDAKETWFGQTALSWAAAENHADVIKLLVEHGADINTVATDMSAPGGRGGGGGGGNYKGGMTPLLLAARNGSLESVGMLADLGADLNKPDPDGITPLCSALLSGNYDVAKLLIEKGADVNKGDKSNRAPLFLAVDMNTLQWRFNRPAPKLVDKLGTNPVDIVKMLLERGADVNAKLTAGILAPKRAATGNALLTPGATPFMKAATTSDLELMKLLYEWGADPYALNRNQVNAVMMAAGMNWKNVDMNASGRPLNRQEEAIDAIKWLLTLGFDINATNDQGQTALHAAAMRSADRDANLLIKYLVDSGANLMAKSKTGRLALDEAKGEDPGTDPNVIVNERRPYNKRSVAFLLELMGLPPETPPAVTSAGGQ